MINRFKKTQLNLIHHPTIRSISSINNPTSNQPKLKTSSPPPPQQQQQPNTIINTHHNDTPDLFESPFHRGSIKNYLRPPLPPIPVTGRITKRKKTDHNTHQTIDYTQFNHGFHSSQSQDQITQLTVSIAIGDVDRARSILLEIERSLGYIRPKPFQATLQLARESTSNPSDHHHHHPLAYRSTSLDDHQHLPTLNQIVHPSIFASLLRKLLLEAIKQESLSNQPQSNLLQLEVFHWLMNFRSNGTDWAQVDHHLMAGVIKGVLFLKQPIYTALDYMPWILPDSSSINYSSSYSNSKPPTLTNVLDSITFMTSQTKSFFGKLDKVQALSKIKSQAQINQRQDVLDEVEIVERRWSTPKPSDHPHPDPNPGSSKEESHQPDETPIALNPVRRPAKPMDDPNQERTIPLRLSHLLSNVSTIPESAGEIFTNPYDRQMVLEYAGYDAAEAEWFEGHKEIKQLGLAGFSNGQGGKTLQAWMWNWWLDLKNWFDSLQFTLDGQVTNSKKETIETDVNFIKVLDNSLIAKVAVVEVIREMTNSTINDGAKSIGLFIALGKAIENEWYAQTIKSIPELNQKLLNSIKQYQDQNLDGQHSRNLDHTIRSIWKNEIIGNYQDELKAIHGDHFDWTIHQRSKVGALVMKGLLETCKITRSTILEDGSLYEEVQPAFYQTTQYFDGKRVGVTKMNEAVAERLDRDPANVTLHPRYLPMVCPPLPWRYPKNGAYLVHGAPLMRTRDTPEQMLHLLESHRVNGLEMIYKSLDKLGRTAWRINKPIFKVMSQVWNSGIELAGIPIRDPHLNLNLNQTDQIERLFLGAHGSPIPTDDHHHPNHNINQSINSDQDDLHPSENPRTEGEKREIFRSLLASRRSAYGQRCSVNYQLEIARAYLNETFYFPHNIDFRGRAYPIPANLNHIGDDISRGLLKFSESKKLGESGLRWLKIHLSNKFGYDKVNLSDRISFIDQNLNLIFDSAENPLNGEKWWLKSEDPWQTLAGCIELREALKSSNVEEYESSLPIHQDGSCNGLQHYAALGGDIEGGKQVNLIPGLKPGDVYTKVADQVNLLINRDADNGHDIAKALTGHIKRKVVKQTVMTTVYGVTFVGAREQIRRQLKDLNVIPIPNLYISAAYVATLVLRSIGEVFQGATAIQKWLTIVARLVSKSIPPERVELIIQNNKTKIKIKKSKDTIGKEEEVAAKDQDNNETIDDLKSTSDSEAPATSNTSKNKKKTKKKSPPVINSHDQVQDDELELMTSMTWTTPLGLVVCQPYRTQNRTQVKTVLQTVYIADPYQPAQADSRSQASAFPPNFIHSLDATHMMLTALACQDITFASVHDSYWTHASDVDIMNKKLRESFVRLHTTRILENLAKEINHRYEGYKVPKNAITSRMMNELKSMGIVNLTNNNSKFLDLNSLIPPLPPRGNLNIHDVVNSEYFFA